jgi:CheY-like chemotaxis protein
MQGRQLVLSLLIEGTVVAITRQEFSEIRVFVVEDNLLVADLVVDALQDSGCSVIGPVSSVEEAIPLAEAAPLDGALLDINLHGEQCFPIAEVLAKRGIPFAFLTGYGDAPVPLAYRDKPLLPKPFRLEDLAKLVKEPLNKQRRVYA